LRFELYPAIAELEAYIRHNSYMNELVEKVTTKPMVVPTSSALGLLLSSAASTPFILTQIASAVAGAGLLAFDSWKTWRVKQSEIERNRLFFYYRASRVLRK
jgi:hypothetical protein